MIRLKKTLLEQFTCGDNKNQHFGSSFSIHQGFGARVDNFEIICHATAVFLFSLVFNARGNSFEESFDFSNHTDVSSDKSVCLQILYITYKYMSSVCFERE